MSNKIESHKNQIIDKMNQDKQQGKEIVLGPADIWLPGGVAEMAKQEPLDQKIDPKNCNVHLWHKVTLFTSTVEECKKCGKLKE